VDDQVYYDVGGWISGPMMPVPGVPTVVEAEAMDNAPVGMVPPNSSAFREFCHAIERALSLPTPATTKDELTYLRISRDRARMVMLACRRIMDDHELEEQDIMAAVSSIRELTRQLPDDRYAAHPMAW